MNKGVFFNMFRNGDLFIVREFVKEIVYSNPHFEWHYAHGNHPDSLKDMPCKYISMPHHPEVCASTKCKGHAISDVLPKFKPLLPQESIRKLSPESDLFINTWTGVYHGYFFPAGHYANMHELVKIWNHIGELLKPITKNHIVFDKNIIEYFPSLDKSVYHSDKISTFMQQNIDNKFSHVMLWANGDSLSNQSRLHAMNHALVLFAKEFPNIAIIATTKFHREMNNIFFTDDIFQLDYDLPLVSLLSEHCDVIVGKNSGPYSYANTRENVNDKNKIFVSFSNAARDNLLYEIDAPCTFVHSDTNDENEVVKILRDIIKNKYQ